MTWSDSFKWAVMAAKSLKCRTVDAHSKPVHHMGSSVFYAGKEKVSGEWAGHSISKGAEPGTRQCSTRYEDIGACVRGKRHGRRGRAGTKSEGA